MYLSQVANILALPVPNFDVTCQSVSIDTRTLTPGALYIAIKGQQLDGHDFVLEAQEKGAVAVLASRAIAGLKIPQLIVPDTKIALGQLARAQRKPFTKPVIALTGSSGKTTTKEMVAAILQKAGRVFASRGNMNNDIGLPLNLLQLTQDVDFAVFELGTNHPGEIAYLAEMVSPTVALVTNVGPAHIGYFGSQEAIAKEKGSIYGALSSEGIAILNVDEPFAQTWLPHLSHCRVITVSQTRPADVRGCLLEAREGCYTFSLQLPQQEAIQVSLPLLGAHHISNALCAAACAYAVGCDSVVIQAGLESVKPVAGRLNIGEGYSGVRVLDDTYNANPSSVRAALACLATFSGERIVVLGDMGELGETSDVLHRTVGEEAKALGIEKMFTCGQWTSFTAAGFGEGAQHFASQEALIKALLPLLNKQVTCLVKGSRSARMEHVVQAIKSK